MTQSRVYTLSFPWSKKVWAITALYFVVALAIIAELVYIWVMGAVVAAVVGLMVSLPILLGIVIYCEGYSPQRLEISDEQITILRRYDSIAIPRSTILSITPIAQSDMAWTMTMGGCGGLFGYFGNFKNRKLGQFKMYATTMRGLYLICTADGRKTVISCSEPELLQKIVYKY